MKIWMTPREEAAFRGFLSPVQNYFEFGCGGSTFAAAQQVPGRIVSIDSSAEWIETVRTNIASLGAAAEISLNHVDIGPLKGSGYPADESRRADWPRYHQEIWDHHEAGSFDLFLIDGRFRVACFLQAALRCRADALLVFHDYANRLNYHGVARLAREVFREENLSAFVRRGDFDRSLALAMLKQHSFAPG